MSYESVKLALNPVAWYRNDEAEGSVMTDSSGNDLHQTYDPLGTLLFGQLSGVETVTTSRSVYSDHGLTNFEVVASDPFDSRVTTDLMKSRREVVGLSSHHHLPLA